jgi:nucleotide sugar dehydrogenase
MPFYPGPGVGGHCIPNDPHYLEWKAKELNFNTNFIALAGEINRGMPEFVVDRAEEALNRHQKAPSTADILVLGVAYKPDVADYRESPAIDILSALREAGANVEYHDPHVPSFEADGLQMKSTPLDERTVARQDLVIVASDHSAIDYEWLAEHADHILDTRNALRDVEDPRAEVERL